MIVRVLHRLVVIAAVVAATLLACAFMGTVHGLDRVEITCRFR
ncbi:hypothetical protein ACFQZ4_05685 [Catellatospora coxensis]